MISRFFVEEKMQWQHHRQHEGTQNGHDAQVQAYEFLSVIGFFFGTEVKKNLTGKGERIMDSKKSEKVSIIWERWSRMMGLVIYFSTKVTKLPCTNMHWWLIHVDIYILNKKHNTHDILYTKKIQKSNINSTCSWSIDPTSEIQVSSSDQPSNPANRTSSSGVFHTSPQQKNTPKKNHQESEI